ncbi:hypothetical protein SAMN05216388_100839 [Halorientalis persicus]|jgi:hypothetical protein|uniref:Uncharacterized protein n=1 Tax=Halorientalis persicus TaxID=1367881 RepID=A0A1H8LWQ1_9EURY|nr:hypothetical protein [Halorientalis persicus]SEO09515.1 hypothetical protein SAMN05216388_100839 [Halorientalis persicus]
MTREAVQAGFAEFVGDIVDTAYDEFDVVAVLRGGSGTSGRLLNKLLKNSRRLDQRVVRPELREYRRRVLDQFEPVLAYAADGDGDFEDYRNRVREADVYLAHLRPSVRGDRRQAIEQAQLDRQRRLAEAARPLVESPESDFWAAAVDALDRDHARDLVQTHFTFTDPLREYPDAFLFETEIDPGDVVGGPLAGRLPSVTVEYTDEVIRVLERAEATVVERALSELDRRFDA